MHEESRQLEVARWAVRQAELAIERRMDDRRAQPPIEFRRLQRAALYLASARWKAARGDWRAAILLASKVQALAARLIRPDPARPDATCAKPVGLRSKPPATHGGNQAGREKR